MSGVSKHKKAIITQQMAGADSAQTLSAPSKVKDMFSVPLTLATVTVVVVTDVAVADAERQTTLVPLAHDDVAQSMPATVPVGVRLVPEKLSPLSVIDSPPEAGTLL